MILKPNVAGTAMRNFQTPDGNVTDEFARLMVWLSSAYASMSGKLPEATIRVYAAALGDLTYVQVRAAMDRVVRESSYWPSVAEIRKAVLGDPQDTALLAWAGLRRAAAEVGAWESPMVVDGTAVAALEAIGCTWPEFCAMVEGAGMHTRRQEFIAAYRHHKSSTSGSRRLTGLAESQSGYVPSREVRLTAGWDVERPANRLTGHVKE